MKTSTRDYVVGFVSAVVLTNVAFAMIALDIADGWTAVFILVGLAIVQLWVQLRYFLHLGRGAKARWNVLMFGFAILIVCILVFGSLWIMKNLNYNMMRSPVEVEREIMEKERIYR